jgi:hypothetical protein
MQSRRSTSKYGWIRFSALLTHSAQLRPTASRDRLVIGTLPLDALKPAAKNHRRAASFISKWRSLHMTKETQKALAIIIAALGVLVILLFWGNHLRPHP